MAMAPCWGASAPRASAQPLQKAAVVLVLLCASAVASASDSHLGSRLRVSPIVSHNSMAEAVALAEPAPEGTQPASMLASARQREAAAPAAATAAAPGPAVAPAPGPALAPASVAQEKADVIKEVLHDKHPGGGYKKGSPLYEKQQALVAKTPVSMTMKCIIGLTVQFFVVYTALFIVQSVNRVKSFALKRLEDTLTCVTKTLFFIPMLCVLFLATRMRAVQLSQGMTERYELPQWWVKQAMLACSIAITMQTVLAALYYALLDKAPDAVKGGSPSTLEKALNFMRWLIIVCLYFGFMAVCIGVCVMQAPEEIWGKAGGPKVSPAVVCTIFLATLYFVIHFCIELVKTLDEFLTPEGKRFGNDKVTQAKKYLIDAGDTVDISPMLCILFLAARLRALQLDPKNGMPTPWAQTFFYVCCASVLGLVLLCIFGRKDKEAANAAAGEERAMPRVSKKEKAVQFLRSAFMFLLCLGAIMVICSMFTQKREKGATPNIPPSVKCTMILTTLYFVVYTSHWVTSTIRKFSPANEFMKKFSNYLEVRAKEAIDFCPMLCILFLGTFMRALQITSGQGAPQPWAQTFMYIGTMAVIIMTVARFDEVIFPPVQENAATPGAKPARPVLLKFFMVMQHMCMLLMHVSVAMVVIALFTITPETAKGAGAISTI